MKQYVTMLMILQYQVSPKCRLRSSLQYFGKLLLCREELNMTHTLISLKICALLASSNDRSDDLDKEAPAECESKTTDDVHGSPEFLPPSAKIKRLASNETPSLDEGCSKPSVCQELLSSQAARTASKEMTAAEKLNLIREQEEKIKQMLVLLETSVKRGLSFEDGI